MSQGRNAGGGAAAALLGLAMAAMELVLLATMTFVVKPMMIRAAITQDFAKAFDFGFVKAFVARVWLELVLSTLFLMVASFVISLAGLLALCVGMLFTPSVIYFAMTHLDRQIYALYLSRGGPEVPVSPDLND
jgi:hypothetical protein